MRANPYGKSPTLDLSRIDFFEPFGTVYIGLFLRYHRSRAHLIAVNSPTNSRALSYLSRVKFFDRFNVPEPDTTRDFPSIGRWTSLNDIIELDPDRNTAEDVEAKLRSLVIANSPRLPVGAICEIVVELVDNFVQHAKRGRAVLTAQYYPQTEKLVVALGDWGIGIKQSLAALEKYGDLASRTDAECIVKAFEPLVTSKHEGGMGLYNVREATQAVGGTLRITSGDGFMTIVGDRMLHGNMRSALSGVQIELEFKAKV